jgi:stringent starvation protein B
MAHDPQTSKRDLLLTLLDEGKVLVRLDARAEGVDVPPMLRDEAELGLNLSYRFAGPLRVEDEGVAATLSFSGEPYACYVPFTAVYAMVSHRTGEGFFFPADAPPSALATLARALEKHDGDSSAVQPASPAQENDRPAQNVPVKEAPEGPPAQAQGAFLRVVEGGAKPPPAETPERASETEQTGRPRLRLVE